MVRNPTVLFVDPEKMARTTFDFRAAVLGIPHFIVTSAEAAVPILEEQQIDVVVTDLFMPQHDGVDLIRCIRETDYTKNIPIIVFTVGGNPQKVAEAISAGATEVLKKQITPMDKLVERIYAAASAARAREEMVSRF